MTEAEYELVDTPESWRRSLAKLRREPRIAVDIEANSLYAYRERICLIQISTEQHNYIIDPLADINITPLQEIFANPAVEKVFHAAEYDLTLIKNLYGWELSTIFDTMWAGRLLGFSKMGLAWFLETMYGITLNKKHQKANWAQRPLSEEKLLYACNDTCHLLRMRDELGRQLAEKGLLEEAEEVFRDVCRPHIVDRSFDPDAFWKLPGVRTMQPRVQAVLRALFVFRDREAKRRDVPPFKVINNHMLLQIARATAKWNGKVPEKLDSIPGVPDKLLERFNPRLAEVIRKAVKEPAPAFPVKHQHHSPGYWQRYQTLLEWRKAIAAERGVESDVILSRSALVELAEKHPGNQEQLAEISTMGAWRREQYGDVIIALLNQ